MYRTSRYRQINTASRYKPKIGQLVFHLFFFFRDLIQLLATETKHDWYPVRHALRGKLIIVDPVYEISLVLSEIRPERGGFIDWRSISIVVASRVHMIYKPYYSVELYLWHLSNWSLRNPWRLNWLSQFIITLVYFHWLACHQFISRAFRETFKPGIYRTDS